MCVLKSAIPHTAPFRELSLFSSVVRLRNSAPCRGAPSSALFRHESSPIIFAISEKHKPFAAAMRGAKANSNREKHSGTREFRLGELILWQKKIQNPVAAALLTGIRFLPC